MALRCFLRNRVKASVGFGCHPKTLTNLGFLVPINNINPNLSSFSICSHHYSTSSTLTPAGEALNRVGFSIATLLNERSLHMYSPHNVSDNFWFRTFALHAVEIYNKKENAHLQFVRVVDGIEELPSRTNKHGINYRITLEATEAGNQKFYYTVVCVKATFNSIKILRWKHIGDGFLDPRSLSQSQTCYDKPFGAIWGEIETEIWISDLALIAVEEHNERENAHLQLLRVVEATEEKFPCISISFTLEETHGDTGVIKSAWIKSLLPFPVDELNGKEDMKVIRGCKSNTTRSLHRITLEATDGDEQKMYRAVVRLSDDWNEEEFVELKPVIDNS